MPLSTFAPSIAPSPGTRHTPNVKLNSAEFGDGYSQNSPRGLNHIQGVIALKWNGLTEAQYNELNDFFTDLGGYRPFYYQPRGYATALKWTCKEWGGSDSAPWSFDAKLEQSFTTET